jgi:ADP-heptose:LPS heptosyltransferase
MHLVTLNNEIQFKNEETGYSVQIRANTQYILPDYLLKQIEEKAPRALQRHRPLLNVYREYSGQPLTNEIVVFIREGGIGDLLFLTPFIKKLRETYPNCKLAISCSDKLAPAMDKFCIPYDVHCFPYPLSVKDLQGALGYPITRENSYFFSFEKLIETDEEARIVNIYDWLEKKLGIFGSDKRPVLIQALTEELTNKIIPWKKDRPLIGFQTSASSPIRSWKPQYIIEFLNSWRLPDTKFVIFDSPHKTPWLKERILKYVSNSNIDVKISTEEFGIQLPVTENVVSLCDFVICPDSSIAHMAAAFNVPIIALFGAFHSELRLSTYKNVLALNVMPECEYATGELKSCCEHGHSCPRAQKMNRVFSPCMDALSPLMVLAASYYWMEKFGSDVSKALESNKAVKGVFERLKDGAN